MKKILFLTLSIVMLLSNSTITSAVPYLGRMETVVSAHQAYTFVGTFSFMYPGNGSGYICESYDVYEKCTVIDGYVISAYYANRDGKYYKLIPCNYTRGNVTYNYYIALSGKGYVKI